MLTLFWKAASAMPPFPCPERLPLLDIWPNRVGPKTIARFWIDIELSASHCAILYIHIVSMILATDTFRDLLVKVTHKVL